MFKVASCATWAPLRLEACTPAYVDSRVCATTTTTTTSTGVLTVSNYASVSAVLRGSQYVILTRRIRARGTAPVSQLLHRRLAPAVHKGKGPHALIIVQELCESRGGRPELSVLTSLLASVDVKIY